MEGPISLDLATDREAALVKGYHSRWPGTRTFCWSPLSPWATYWAKPYMGLARGGQMAGVVLGAAVPITINSRGATPEEKYYSILLCAAMD